METIEYILRIILFLVGFCALLFLTYVTTRYIGQRQLRTMQGKNISILETVMLGADKKLHLVKAGKNYVLIASTSKSVEFLTNVEIDETTEEEPAESVKDIRFDFRTILDKYAGMYREKKKTKAVVKSEDADEKQDEQKFRQNLDKLRTIVYKSQNVKTKEDGVDVTNDKKTEGH